MRAFLLVPLTPWQKNSPHQAGYFSAGKTELLQLGFLVFHMLAGLGIKLHERHFLGHGFLVLAGGVEVTGTGRRFQLDFFASAFGCHGAAP
jgi:hypothetical protein